MRLLYYFPIMALFASVFPRSTAAAKCNPGWTPINMMHKFARAGKVNRLIERAVVNVTKFYSDLICVRSRGSLNISLPTKTCGGETLDFSHTGAFNDSNFVTVFTVSGDGTCKGKGSTIAYASHCVSMPDKITPREESNRPIGGHVTLCKGHLPEREADLYKFQETLKHEIMHALFFSDVLFKRTTPNIKRAKENIKWDYIDKTSGRKASHNFEFEFVRSPKVLDFIKSTFNCTKKNPGAALEESGGTGTQGSHWDGYWYAREIMAGRSTERSHFTHLSAALMEDTNWYQIRDPSMLSAWPYDKNVPCSFLLTSCLEAVQNRLKRPHHICGPKNVAEGGKASIDERNDYKCNKDGSAVLQCPLKAGKMTKEEMEQIDGDFTKLKKLGPMIYKEGFHGTDPYFMFCPVWAVASSSKGQVEKAFARTCFLNQTDLREANFQAESFGRKSRCFETSAKRFESFRRKACHDSAVDNVLKGGGSRFDMGAGAACYQFRCHFGRLQIKPAGEEVNKDRWLTCYAEGNKLKVSRQLSYVHQGKTMKGIYQGVIICPKCQDVCNAGSGYSGFTCGKEEKDIDSRDIQQLCSGSSGIGVLKFAMIGILWLLSAYFPYAAIPLL